MGKSNSTLVMAIGILTLAAIGCSDGGDPVAPVDPLPGIAVSLSKNTVEIGEEASLSVSLNGVDAQVFALSIRIGFDEEVVNIDEETGFVVGDFIGNEAIALFQIEDEMIYISVTNIADKGKSLRSGAIGDILFSGASQGQCEFTVDPEDLRFIDATGAEMAVNGLEMTGIVVNIQ
jgi:hypothetical protein